MLYNGKLVTEREIENARINLEDKGYNISKLTDLEVLKKLRELNAPKSSRTKNLKKRGARKRLAAKRLSRVILKKVNVAKDALDDLLTAVK